LLTVCSNSRDYSGRKVHERLLKSWFGVSKKSVWCVKICNLAYQNLRLCVSNNAIPYVKNCSFVYQKTPFCMSKIVVLCGVSCFLILSLVPCGVLSNAFCSAVI